MAKELPTPTNALASLPQEPANPEVKKENGSLAAESDSESEAEEEDDSDEESSGGTSSEVVSSDEEEEDERPPVPPLPSVIVVPDEEIEESPALASVQKEMLQQKQSSPVFQPKLALQEDFDLSPSSEASHCQVQPERPEQPSTNLARAPSKESVDSSKFAMTETEFSDWTGADNSLEGELDMDSLEGGVLEPSKQDRTQDRVAPDVAGGAHLHEDIGFADESEAPPLSLKGYTKLVEEVPSPVDVKQLDKSVEESPDLPSMSFGRQRDSIAVYRDKQAALHTPVAAPSAAKEENGHRDLQRRMLEKKSESSPSLIRKKEALSQVI